MNIKEVPNVLGGNSPAFQRWMQVKSADALAVYREAFRNLTVKSLISNDACFVLVAALRQSVKNHLFKNCTEAIKAVSPDGVLIPKIITHFFPGSFDSRLTMLSDLLSDQGYLSIGYRKEVLYEFALQNDAINKPINASRIIKAAAKNTKQVIAYLKKIMYAGGKPLAEAILILTKTDTEGAPVNYQHIADILAGFHREGYLTLADLLYEVISLLDKNWRTLEKLVNLLDDRGRITRQQLWQDIIASLTRYGSRPLDKVKRDLEEKGWTNLEVLISAYPFIAAPPSSSLS